MLRHRNILFQTFGKVLLHLTSFDPFGEKDDWLQIKTSWSKHFKQSVSILIQPVTNVCQIISAGRGLIRLIQKMFYSESSLDYNPGVLFVLKSLFLCVLSLSLDFPFLFIVFCWTPTRSSKESPKNMVEIHLTVEKRTKKTPRFYS